MNIAKHTMEGAEEQNRDGWKGGVCVRRIPADMWDCAKFQSSVRAIHISGSELAEA